MTAGLYIHVPFCSSVCPYCDFAVTIAREGSKTIREARGEADARRASCTAASTAIQLTETQVRVAEAQLRLRWNPFYEYVQTRALEFAGLAGQ